MLRQARRSLLLLVAAALATAGLVAAPQPAQAAVFGRQPEVTCASENYPQFASDMADFMRLAVNVGTVQRYDGLHEPSVAFYDYATGTECYTTKDAVYETGSVVKAMILATLLRRPGGLTSAERPLAENMILTSDNEDALTLWTDSLGCGKDAGGTVRPCTEFRDFLDAAGMHHTYPDDEGAYGDTHTNAFDAVQLFKVFASPNALLSTERREYALNLFERAKPRYGVPSFAPPGTVQRLKIGHKKNADDPNLWISNSIGQVQGGGQGYNYLMAIFTNRNEEFDIPFFPWDTPSNGPARVDRIAEQLNCGVRELNGDNTCWSYKSEGCFISSPDMSCLTSHPLRSHRSQHWVRVSIGAKLGSTVHWKVMDAANGIVVDEGDAVGGPNCTCQKTIYGLYGSYILLLDTNVANGGDRGSISNYTGDPQPGSNQPPVVNAGPALVGQEGWPVDITGFANDDDGIPAVRWNAEPTSDVDAGGSCTFSDPTALRTSVTCNDDGTFILTLSATDGSHEPVTDRAELTLWNLAPALRGAAGQGAATIATSDDGFDSPDPWQVFRAGDSVPLSARFSDLGTNDTHTCSIAWDDGQTESVQAHDQVCSAAHAFTQPGMYTIKTTVTDDDGARVSGEVLVIVYDPDGGFATAGASFDSPAGALSSARDATGRLKIELNPAYKPSDPGPEVGRGKVSARLSSAEFSLDSKTLDWLVVTPAGKVAVKGTGTVNGQTGYGFVVYGYDDPDRLRLVVWNLSEGAYPGDSVIYDNRRAGDYDLDRANPQEIAGGSFQTHL